MSMRFLAVTLAALGVAVHGGGHEDHMAVVRVFSTAEEVNLLMSSIAEWEALGVCSNSSKTPMTDLILVYSKDLAADPNASMVVAEYEAIFASRAYNWTGCFGEVKNLSAKLSPEEDTYDADGYSKNKHWVKGPNTVFKSIMGAFYTGAFADEYKSFFLMEMDAVPIMANWLDQFEMEGMEMESQNMAVRGSQYLGDKWDLFKHVMPTYLVEHINGNAIYNLKHAWTRYLYDAFTTQGDDAMLEEMAFDVAFAMITMSAMDGSEPVFAAAWANSNGSSATYNNDTMLVGHYANTLLHKSFEFGKFIRHGSSKNLFDSLMSDKVTLGVAAYDKSTGHLMDTVATNHPFKKILMLTHYPTPNVTETIPAPGDNVSLTTQEASSEPYMHLCEVAELVTTDWFALTDNYHIINAPVSVLMDGELPMLPYVTSESKYSGERSNCKASLDQATSLFGVELTCTSVRLG